MRIALSLLLGLAACVAGAIGIYFYRGQTVQLPTAVVQHAASVPLPAAPTPVKTETFLPDNSAVDARAQQEATPQATEAPTKRPKKKRAQKKRSTKSPPQPSPQGD